MSHARRGTPGALGSHAAQLYLAQPGVWDGAPLLCWERATSQAPTTEPTGMLCLSWHGDTWEKTRGGGQRGWGDSPSTAGMSPQLVETSPVIMHAESINPFKNK